MSNDSCSSRERILLFPKKDPQTLAETLAYLVNNPDLRARMGTIGRQTANNYRCWVSPIATC